ncbi:MAG: alpha/beta fold hydrolase [Pseudomonadota bacterium]
MAILPGCASVEPLADGQHAPPALPVRIADGFCYDAPPPVAEFELLKEKRRFTHQAGSFSSGLPGDKDDTPITFEYYELPGDEPAPVAIVLPILNGQKDIVRPFASYFAKHGYASIIVDTSQRRTLSTDLVDPERALRAAVQRHRRMLDWVETQDKLDAERVVVFGASLGGINAMYLASLDDRIRAVVPALAAGDLPMLFIETEEPRVRNAVADAKATLEMTSDEFRRFLEDNIETRILELAGFVDASRVQMVIARYDDTVPTAQQRDLRAALGNPETITLPTGHLTAAAYIFYLRKKALRFFDRILEESPEGTTVRFDDAVCSTAGG